MLTNIFQLIRSTLPDACIVCGRAADRDYSICSDCECGLPRLGGCCSRCGVELGSAQNRASCCNMCLRSPPRFTTCRAAFSYISPINKLVASFKFSARFDIGYSLARVLACAFNAHYGECAKPELLLPVPLHRSRLHSRGFNQAREICKVLSSYCQVKAANSVLLKTRNTEAQTAMKSAAARKTNLRGAFALRNLNSLHDVTHIALVDDVVTTMATIEAITKLLQSQRECRIDVWCLARANR